MIMILFTLVLSAACCGLYLKLARRWQILDIPNERSSHQLPTPHSGGVPLLLAFFLAVLAAGLSGSPWPREYLLLSVAALFLMSLGVWDDLKGLSVRLRFALYTVCCLFAVNLLLRPLAGGGGLDWVLALVAVIALLWSLNLYNFMDGIDGIAAIQCVLACGGAALLSWASGADGFYPLFCLLLAAAHLGFLVWNWSPARLFMGDAGSIPTGFLLGCLAILGAVQGQLPLACWLILLAAFITDASSTLLWRMATGQAFTQAHRLHAYQRLSRYWNSHLAVDFALLALNALWLFPLAWAAQAWPGYSLILVILVYIPLLAGMAKSRKLS